MTGIFLQARLDSSRLPQKALALLGTRTILEHCMAALTCVPAHSHVLLTDERSADTFRPLAGNWGFELFVGSDLDVLDRFARAADLYGVDTIVRATGDNPLVCPMLARRILDEHRSISSDYSGFVGMPLGTGVEVLSSSALFEADRAARDSYCREHVAPYIYRHPMLFKTHRPIVETALQDDTHVTVDTPSDLEAVRHLFSELYRGLPIEATELVSLLRRERLRSHQQTA